MCLLKLLDKSLHISNGPPSVRVCVLNSLEENREYGYAGNRISTGKYNLFTFLPKNLFEQFHRAANCYFLAMFVLSMLPWTNAINPGTSAIPLTFVLSVSALKDAAEDYKRHKSDSSINNSSTRVLRKCETSKRRKCRGCCALGLSRRGSHDSLNSNCSIPVFDPTQWRSVEVGDIIEIRRDEFVPADVLILTSSDDDGLCYIETANIDGETNLKVREPVAHLHGLCIQPEGIEGDQAKESLEKVLSGMKGVVEYPPPNNNLLSFSGTVNLTTAGSVLSHDGQTLCKERVLKLPISMNNVLLRGCKLRNISVAYGLVLYAGHDTKLMQNDTVNRFKRTHIEQMMNKEIIIVFFILMGVCFVGAVLSNVWTSDHANKTWYLYFPENATLEGFLNFFNFILILQSFVPISLYVSVEMVKVVQAYFIQQDRTMYDEESDTPANARTSALSEELGQINYIFSDKTGTLTRNQMEFYCCNIRGITYGLEGDAYFSDAESDGGKFATTSCPYYVESNQFHSTMLLKDLCGKNLKANYCLEFFLCLSVCHTIIPEYNTDTCDDTGDGKENSQKSLSYQAQSPDESALAYAARSVGIAFHTRQQTNITVNILGEDRTYELLHILEFSSERKRMSVIVRCPRTEEVILYCKGADDVILHRLGSSGDQDGEEKLVLEDSREALRHFAGLGLRTLCVARKVIATKDYKAWVTKWEAKQVSSSSNAEERQRSLNALAEEIETDLVLLGISGIDDQLQYGVPETISSLKEAGIKLWVLTGDKQETAINIGFSAELLNENQNVIIVNAECKEETIDILHKAQAEFICPNGEQAAFEKNALVINGSTLHFALEKDVRNLFLRIATSCASVICCRCSPLQKAMIVRLVGHYKSATSLAIGDGANDVSMIKEADVGVGISGQEGMQAVLASDYSIAQFRFLAPLLLVHGRWSYNRITWAILYFFYKNYTFILVNFWFALFSGFSAQTLYEFTYIMLFNVTFTALPPLVVAVFDQDVSAEASLRFPILYRENLTGEKFNTLIFWRTVVGSLYQSLIVFFIPMLSFTVQKNGDPVGLQALGTLIFMCVVIIINLRLALDVHNWTILNYITTIGSISFLFVYMVAYHSILPTINLAFGVIFRLLPSISFWCIILVVSIICLAPHWLFCYYQSQFNPLPSLIVREIEKLKIGDFAEELDRKTNRQQPLSAGSRANSLGALSRGSIQSQVSVVKLKASDQTAGQEEYSGFAFSYPARLSNKVWCKVRGLVGQKRKPAGHKEEIPKKGALQIEPDLVEDSAESLNFDRLQQSNPEEKVRLSISQKHSLKTETKSEEEDELEIMYQEDDDEFFYSDNFSSPRGSAHDNIALCAGEDTISETVSGSYKGDVNSSFSAVEIESSPNTTVNYIETDDEVSDVKFQVPTTE